MSELSSLLKKPEFPRSAKYDPDWMMDNQMGPNALWLMEWLCEALQLEPGMRVLKTSMILPWEPRWAWIGEGSRRRSRVSLISGRVLESRRHSGKSAAFLLS